jgi:HK97 family phage prohead protease
VGELERFNGFSETIDGKRIPMLFQHDPSEPVGIWLELREDHRGHFARGRLFPDVTRGRELLSLLRAGAIDGLSIGFRTANARIDPRTRIRRLYAVDLWGISIVTFPMLTGARVRTVKRAHRRPTNPSANYRFPKNPKSSMTRFSWRARIVSMSATHVSYLFVPAGMPRFSQNVRLSKAISTLRCCSRTARAPAAV